MVTFLTTNVNIKYRIATFRGYVVSSILTDIHKASTTFTFTFAMESQYH